ncbi:MAG: hypothetical protein ACO1PW_09295, partial [Actinomycetota bacterium]
MRVDEPARSPIPATAPSDAWVGPIRHDSGMPIIGESVVPWLGAALVIGLITLLLAVNGQEVGATEQMVLAVGMAGTIAAAGLVVARSRRALAEVIAEERLRPAVDQIAAPLGTDQVSYNEGMQHWTASVLELLEHAAGVLAAESPRSADHQALVTAAEDTRDLHELLAVEAAGRMGINEQARLHALGALWETGEPRFEALAASADPAWYRRWRSRA